MHDALRGLPVDVQLKLRRATWHLQMLNAQVGSFDERDPYGDTTDFHPVTPYEADYVVRMKVNREPLPEWSLTIGDCLHNLRASLDYAVLALWRRHSGCPPRMEDVQFPIYSTQDGFRRGRRRRIGGVHPGAKRIIRLAQPYQRRDDARMHPLMVLSELSNHDKHRVLHTTHAVVQESVLEVAARENAVIAKQSPLRVGAFNDGDEVFRVRVVSVGPKPKLDLVFKPTYGVAFAQDGPGRGGLVANLLNDMRLYIRDELLASLRPYF